jgi:hypothetical protein
MHPNEELIRRGYEAFANGDIQTLSELFDDDIVWCARGDTPLAGDYRGQEAVFGLFGRLTQLTGGTFTLQIEDVVANDERVAVMATSHATIEGLGVMDRQCAVYTVRDGKVTRAEFYFEDPTETNRLLSQAADVAIGTR